MAEWNDASKGESLVMIGGVKGDWLLDGCSGMGLRATGVEVVSLGTAWSVGRVVVESGNLGGKPKRLDDAFVELAKGLPRLSMLGLLL